MGSVLCRSPISSRAIGFVCPVPGSRPARSTWGARFVLRSLGDRRGDEARLAAARLGRALAQFFSGLRAMVSRRNHIPRSNERRFMKGLSHYISIRPVRLLDLLLRTHLPRLMPLHGLGPLRAAGSGER